MYSSTLICHEWMNHANEFFLKHFEYIDVINQNVWWKILCFLDHSYEIREKWKQWYFSVVKLTKANFLDMYMGFCVKIHWLMSVIWGPRCLFVCELLLWSIYWPDLSSQSSYANLFVEHSKVIYIFFIYIFKLFQVSKKHTSASCLLALFTS